MSLPEPIPSENTEQALVVQWFRRTYPGELIFAVPNGGSRSKSTAAMLKATGVVAGIPDLFIPKVITFVEMKRRKGGKVSPEQEAIMAQLRAMGYLCLVCHGFEQAKDEISKVMPPCQN